MEIKRFVCGLISENCFLLREGGVLLVVDPGFFNAQELDSFYDSLGGAGITAVLLTHGHFDHVMAVKAIQDRFGCPVFMHPADTECLADSENNSRKLGLKNADFSFKVSPVSDGQILRFEGFSSDIKVIATPGHTPGCVCYYLPAEGLLLSGDTLFRDSIGRTDMAFGDYDSEIVSIMEKLMLLPGSTDVLPGHGGVTTIERERTSNPFLEPFNEKEEEFSDELPGISIHR